MTTYDVPDEILVGSDGPIRVITLNRPENLNATNHVLHAGLAGLWPQIDADEDARVAVLTGAGRAFSAGGDFNYIDELSKDRDLRHLSLTHGKQIVTGMVRCRVPIVAAVNGPAVGLGCSLVALSDIVFMAETAHLADPHVLLGLVAADGGPVVWPLLTSLQLAKEYALTGDRIPAERAAAMGLVNHVVPDDEVLVRAMECAQRLAKLPQGAVEDTKRIFNIQMERAVLSVLDYALERGGPFVHVARAAGQRGPHAQTRARGRIAGLIVPERGGRVPTEPAAVHARPAAGGRARLLREPGGRD